MTSIKLYIYVEWGFDGRRGGDRIIKSNEKRDELDIPIEEFNEKLNDAQTFELYTDEKYEDATIKLIEKCDTTSNYIGQIEMGRPIPSKAHPV